jgi:hypothetical protein
MKIINPEKNIERVISLINNAKEKVVIVSPFNDLNGWDELKAAINRANTKLEVSYYVRKGEGRNGIDGIRATVYEVPLLHAKMFFSENEALISSGNLTNRPDINWFCELDTEEYKDIVGFFEQYIRSNAKQLKP